jgi:hypothetical protein
MWPPTVRMRPPGDWVLPRAGGLHLGDQSRDLGSCDGAFVIEAYGLSLRTLMAKRSMTWNRKTSERPGR